MAARKQKKRQNLEDDADGAARVDDDDKARGVLEEKRRKLRGALRTNLDSLKREKSEMIRGDRSSRQRTQDLKTNQDSLFAKVQHTREFVLDSEANVLLAKIVAEQALNVDVALSNDTPGEFAAKLKNWLSQQPGSFVEGASEAEDEAARWSALARMASRHYPMCPGPSFVFGPIPVVPVVRQARKPRMAEDKVEKEKVVKELEDDGDPNAVSLATMKQVDKLQESLKAAGSYPVWKLVSNPLSMAQTVEHMFHLSFLVKEGKAKITPDKAQGMIVKPHRPPAENEEVERVQAIVRLDKAQLDAAIARYKISKPVLEHRVPVAEARQSSGGAAAFVEQPLSSSRSSKSANRTSAVTPGSAVDPTQMVDSEPVSATTTPIGTKRARK